MLYCDAFYRTGHSNIVVFIISTMCNRKISNIFRLRDLGITMRNDAQHLTGILLIGISTLKDIVQKKVKRYREEIGDTLYAEVL